MIEHYEGKFPAWLSPIQAAILTITDKQDSYVRDVEKRLKANGLRVISDLRNEKVGFKIREHTLQAIPYLLVVGDREVENGELAVRTQSGEDLGTMAIDDFASLVQERVARFSSDSQRLRQQKALAQILSNRRSGASVRDATVASGDRAPALG